MTSSDKSENKLPGRIASICFWIALWAALAAYIGNDLLLASPLATLEAFTGMLAAQNFWFAVALSSSRIMGASIASAIVGIILGLLASHVRSIETLLELPIQVMKSAPVACVVVVLLVAFGSAGAIIVIVAFVALPPFYVASLQASRAALDDRAHVLEAMGLSKAALFFAHTWPAVLPLYQHAAKTAVALSWRAGITGELLSIPLGSMGAAIYASKLTLDAPALLAWTIVVMLLAFACEAATVGILNLTAASPKLALRMRRSRSESSADLDQKLAKEPLLRLSEIAKAYDSALVLQDISLTLAPSERICLMAPTGSGKTTLLRVALEMEAPDVGTVMRPALCGVVLQQPTLIGNLSAWENAELVADARRNVGDMRNQMQMLLPEGTLDHNANALSGGTKRLTEIARAVFSPGTCLMLDEPFAGLDPVSKERACSFIRRNIGNRPLIVATHDETDVELLGATLFRL